ncbi:MAG: cupin domain-containing protein [Gammaproteobacteria bacterium]|nr:cupin domain-containing protein [Gammaproteobacteria bacterium]
MLRFLAGFLTALVLTLPLAVLSDQQLSSLVHLNEKDVPWPALDEVPEDQIPEELRAQAADFRRLSEVMRWKTLIGTGGRFGEGLPDRDMHFGIGEIGPGAIYPRHRHPTPELYYFISGSARWVVDGEEFVAEPGSAVYMKPFAVHRMEVTSDESAVVVWADWAPDCDRSTLHGGYELMDPVPEQPERAKITR